MVNRGIMNTRKQLSGKIFSNKMDKTVVVEVVKRFAHPIYKKYVNRTKKYYAHDPQNLCQIGDVVLIEESKPVSRLKRWRVKEIQEKVKK
tara:strand:+ start:133 stop:402 length:270 start_codon:yes stop_codon:yes gene_type:complete